MEGGRRGQAILESVEEPAKERLFPDPVKTRGKKPSLRDRAIEVVAEQPGATIQGVARALGCSHPTAAYHLNALVKLGKVIKEPEGRMVRHFPAGVARSPKVHLQAQLREPRRLLIALFLTTPTAPQMCMNRVANRLNLPFGYVKRTLITFKTVGLIEMEQRLHQYSVRPRTALLTGLKELLGRDDLEEAFHELDSTNADYLRR